MIRKKSKVVPISANEIKARMSDGSSVYKGFWAGKSERQVKNGLIKDYTDFYKAQGYDDISIKFI
ncbi:MAG: hypothetical protein LBS50_10465 [Prevotellaceae bacterium]|jgi:hypothetical protein|nr:hypothetical protein [Prevotellaceae bacterium]